MISAFAIDLGIPIPPRPGKQANQQAAEYPFEQMKVGDSFFTPGFSTRARVAASEYSHLHPPITFTSRAFATDPITGGSGVRIWRTR